MQPHAPIERTRSNHFVVLARAMAVARPAKPGLDRVTVNSSRFAVPAYERLGVRQTGPERQNPGWAAVGGTSNWLKPHRGGAHHRRMLAVGRLETNLLGSGVS